MHSFLSDILNLQLQYSPGDSQSPGELLPHGTISAPFQLFYRGSCLFRFRFFFGVNKAGIGFPQFVELIEQGVENF